jgi:hypothetical protein
MVQASTSAALTADKVSAGMVLASGMVASETVAMAASIATAGAINLMGQALAFKLTGAGATEPHQSHDSAPPCGGLFFEAALRGPVLWRTVADHHGAPALERRLRPCARKFEQGPFLFFGLGLASPKQGLLGVFPELIGF